MRRNQERLTSNALQQHEQAHCEIEILQNEVHRFLLQTSFKLFDQETSALARAFELNGKQLAFYINPWQ
jgi:hypothetical protein